MQRTKGVNEGNACRRATILALALGSNKREARVPAFMHFCV